MTSFLHGLRIEAVLAAVCEAGARTVLDLGCGDGDLLLRLAVTRGIETILGIDQSVEALARLRERLDACRDGLAAKVNLVRASLLDPGAVPEGFDCALLIEVIEHLEPDRLSLAEKAVFAQAAPPTVIVTTPNVEFNGLLGVPAGRFRHPDHRFEWDRRRFSDWAAGVAARHGYRVECRDIAGAHPRLGGASQMALFRRTG
ncbi:MAG: methyltransferase domain-containing protein [Rhizobiaceae bacterium]|nr:methyltransferase domain-containing protein [Rhizobiaceae bacterium]MCV0408323.1 methyltransferase domain-containing protein [Rhizobiaceae bacterium]